MRSGAPDEVCSCLGTLKLSSSVKVDFVALNGLFLQTHMIWLCFAVLVCLIMSTLLFDLLTEGEDNCHLHFLLDATALTQLTKLL